MPLSPALFLNETAIYPGQNMDTIIATKSMQVERKFITIEFRENPRGRFLRITEEVNGRRNAIIVPSTGVAEFTAAIDEVLSQAEKETPL